MYVRVTHLRINNNKPITYSIINPRDKYNKINIKTDDFTNNKYSGEEKKYHSP